MKKYFLLLVAALLAFSSCGDERQLPETVDPVFNLLEHSDSPVEFEAVGGSVDIPYETNCDWTASCGAEWCTLSPESGSKGSGAIRITAAENGTKSRNATVSIHAGKLIRTVSVTQKAQEVFVPVLTINTKTYEVKAAGETIEVSVNTNLDLNVTTSDSWVSEAGKLSEGGVVKYSFTVAPNDTKSARTATVNFANDLYAKKVTVTIKQETDYVRPTISILAIGNSFSVDAMEYLYQILQQCGYEEIHLGNLYIGGCTLQTHSNNVTANSASYTYYTNDSGSWKNVTSYKPNDAISSRKWDYISVQQASGSSGIESTYEPYLTTVINKCVELCPEAKLMWHMTWAYQQNSTHSEFPKYQSDQMTMYNMIVSAVKNKVLPHNEIKFVIPCGTAIQNVRTSPIGDTVTRDGYHMSYNIGRFVTALMWAKQISECDLNTITYKPSSYSYTADQIKYIKEAVENAFLKPYEVTKSVDALPDPEPPVVKPNSDLHKILQDNGYDLSKYDEMALSITHYAYYNSTSGTPSVLISAATGSTASNLSQFAATQIFKKSELPNGTLIVQKSGFQYRPEAWTQLGTKTVSRPGNTTAQITTVDVSWWGDFNFRAFNLAKSGNPNLTAAEQEELDSCFGIFVPKEFVDESKLSCDELLDLYGYDVTKYTKKPLTLTHNAYYNSSNTTYISGIISAETGSTATNLTQFACTEIFSKEDIPAGSVIVCRSGYQYRPEGWVSLSTANSSSNRPGNVLTRVVLVNDAWWGSFNFRAFNLAKANNPNLTAEEQKTLEDCFAIYLPK